MSDAPRWTTSSYGDSADTRPAELAALREHLTQCSARSGRLVALQCGWLRVQGFVVSRLVTTAALLGLAVTATVFLLL